MAEKLKDGLHRCPHCGSSDVALDAKQGKLKCAYCKTVFEAKSANEAGGVRGMKGETRGAGADDIIPGDDIVKTFKCPSCGAQVVINTDEALNADCHWCRHAFSVNDAVSNGAVPDLVLPFKISKEEALEKARECIKSRSESIDETFVKELDTRGMDGVYFPYFIVDVNARMEMKGKAEVNLEPNKEASPWKTELYDISRDFTVLVDDLTVESSSARLNQDTFINSNHIINAILPFDTENAVAWDARYLKGFSSEKRNVNVDSLKEIVALQTGDIARRKAKETTTQYDRGVCWTKEHLGIKGTKWKAAYLPVWLFSYRRETNVDARIYYIAVNARTGETVGCLPTVIGGLKSVLPKPQAAPASPQQAPKKKPTAIIVFGAMMFLSFIIPSAGLSALLFMIAFFALPIAIIKYSAKNVVMPSQRGGHIVPKQTTHYVNTETVSRHRHETDTIATIEDVSATDKMVETNRRSYSRYISGRNEDRVIGALSTGRDEMLDVERGRFQNGRNYTNAAARRKKNNADTDKIIGIIIFIFILMMILSALGGGGGGGGSSSYDSGWDSGWDSSSSWDSGWDSGSDWDSGGFDYSYDY